MASCQKFGHFLINKVFNRELRSRGSSRYLVVVKVVAHFFKNFDDFSDISSLLEFSAYFIMICRYGSNFFTISS